LTHDFTHRTHLEIFDGAYYPPELTDWFLDNWISRVYGSARSKQLANVEVFHHMKTHGTRYNITYGAGQLLENLLQQGRQKIVAFMKTTGVSAKHIEEYERSRFDNFLLKR